MDHTARQFAGDRGRVARFLLVIDRPLALAGDLALIALVAFFFVQPIFDFNDAHVPSNSPDWEASTSSMQLARSSLIDDHVFPLWNPYFRTGVPFLAEPKTHIFNPIASVPSLIWGVPDGSKIAAGLSSVLAGLAMYYLATVSGLSRPWRIWCGVLMALCGAFAAKVFVGHFNLITGLPYVPLVFALCLQALRKPGPIWPLLAGVACALLFFSGQYYYTIYAVPGVALTLVMCGGAAAWQNGRLAPGAVAAVLVRGLIVMLWAAGFSAVQLLPQLESQEYFLNTPSDLVGAQTVFGSALNFFVSDRDHLDANFLGRTWGWWEYYYYVGVVPLMGLAFVAGALRRTGNRFAVLWAAAMFALYLSWASAPYTFVQWFYNADDSLYRLRIPTRTLAFATPFLILLAAFGLQSVTDWLANSARLRPAIRFQQAGQLRIPAGPAAALIVIGLAFYGLRDVYHENRESLAGTIRIDKGASAAAWIRARDDSLHYVGIFDLQQAVPVELYEMRIKRFDAWWEYAYVPPKPTIEGVPGTLIVAPKYLVGDPGQSIRPRLIGNVLGRNVYELPQSPHYASTLRSSDVPLEPAQTITFDWGVRSHAAEARLQSANEIEVSANPPPGDDRLLVIETYHPGWRLEVDGHRRGSPENFGGFLSTPALPGEHTYTFIFDPASFRYGAAVSVGTSLGAAALMGYRYGLRPLREALRAREHRA